MISIAYEVTSLALSRYGGIATACFHSLAEAARHPEITPTALYRRGSPLVDALPDLPWKKTRALHTLRPPKYDIVHALCHRLPPTRGRKRVYTLHDAWSLAPNNYQPPTFQQKLGARLRRELRAVDLIITDSAAGRDALLSHNLVDPDRVTVAYPGCTLPDLDTESTPSRLLAPLLEQPFVLFVGRLETRKNIRHILDAVLPLDDIQLVLVGEPGFGFEPEIESALEHFSPSRLHQFSLIANHDLSQLYRHALATLQPSWEEGFGLPILEAMGHGCPVITSNCSAPPEIVGDAGILVDPTNPAQSRDALLRLLNDPLYRRQLIESGRQRAAQFTWGKYFETLRRAYATLS